MSTTTKVVLALIVIAMLAYGGSVMYTRSQVADALRSAFAAAGMPEEWGEALGKVESNLSMGAINNTGPDAARGGAWGATQITEKTARGYGYTGPMEKLTTDLNLMASLSAQIASAGKPQTIEDLGAWWNAGHRTFDSLPADHVTRTTYVPRLERALEAIS